VAGRSILVDKGLSVKEVVMAGQAVPMLVVYEGELEGARWVIDQESVVIGRGSDCDIVLPERQVSRQHVRIERDSKGYLLHDLGSKNGTSVNGEEVGSEPVRLKDGDEIQVALCVKFGFVGADATLPLESPGPRRGIRIEEASRRVFVGDREIVPPLSLAQYRLLVLLCRRKGQVVLRDEVVSTVWTEEEAAGVSEQAIDALVRRLRERIDAIDPGHDYIVTVRGHGFRLEY
jgi:hypothetical protein